MGIEWKAPEPNLSWVLELYKLPSLK